MGVELRPEMHWISKLLVLDEVRMRCKGVQVSRLRINERVVSCWGKLVWLLLLLVVVVFAILLLVVSSLVASLVLARG